MEDQVEGSLARLAKIAARINAESTQINEKIAEIEDALNRLGLGVTAWVSLDGGSAFVPPRFGDGQERDLASPEDPWTHTAWFLGYLKMKDGWHLATRSLAVEKPDAPQRIMVRSEPVPLLKAPRHVRVLALGQMQDLLTELETRASAFLTSMEFAGDPANREKLKRRPIHPDEIGAEFIRMVQRMHEEDFDSRAPGVIVVVVDPVGGSAIVAGSAGIEIPFQPAAYSEAGKFLTAFGAGAQERE